MKDSSRWWVAGGLVAVAGGLMLAGAHTETVRKPVPTPAPAPDPVVAQPDRPVSAQCQRVTDMLEQSGAIRPGEMTREGAVLLTDSRWTRLSFADQSGAAACLSHRIAGSQDRWTRKITFRNQATGVVYGTIENTRYRSGP